MVFPRPAHGLSADAKVLSRRVDGLIRFLALRDDQLGHVPRQPVLDRRDSQSLKHAAAPLAVHLKRLRDDGSRILRGVWKAAPALHRIRVRAGRRLDLTWLSIG